MPWFLYNRLIFVSFPLGLGIFVSRRIDVRMMRSYVSSSVTSIIVSVRALSVMSSA